MKHSSGEHDEMTRLLDVRDPFEHAGYVAPLEAMRDGEAAGYRGRLEAIERDHATRLGVVSRLLQKFLTRDVAAIGNQKICGFGSSCIAVARCTQRPTNTKVSS